MRWSDQAILAATQAHAEAEGFISPDDDAWDSMRAALTAAVRVDGPFYCKKPCYHGKTRGHLDHLNMPCIGYSLVAAGEGKT